VPVAVGVVALLLALVVLEAVVLVEQQAGLAAMELQTQEVGVVALSLLVAAQAAQESSSLNTSPSPITKSSRAAAHGLALPGLLRSST
jgi:hypothetical protein